METASVSKALAGSWVQPEPPGGHVGLGAAEGHRHKEFDVHVKSSARRRTGRDGEDEEDATPIHGSRGGAKRA
jgi:hypothetical protein